MWRLPKFNRIILKISNVLSVNRKFPKFGQLSKKVKGKWVKLANFKYHLSRCRCSKGKGANLNFGADICTPDPTYDCLLTDAGIRKSSIRTNRQPGSLLMLYDLFLTKIQLWTRRVLSVPDVLLQWKLNWLRKTWRSSHSATTLAKKGSRQRKSELSARLEHFAEEANQRHKDITQHLYSTAVMRP